MHADDRRYFHQRAETELSQARNATCDEAAKVHYTLAGYYLDRACGDLPGEEAPRHAPLRA